MDVPKIGIAANMQDLVADFEELSPKLRCAMVIGLDKNDRVIYMMGTPMGVLDMFTISGFVTSAVAERASRF